MEIYLVGGAVRDALLGHPVVDRDWVVVGATAEQLLAQGYLQVGKDFPVFLHPLSREEFALARTERKSGPGYRGFMVHASPEVTLEEDLARRDLTINAVAVRATPSPAAGHFEPDFSQVIDPFNGRTDLQGGVLRHVTDAFREDPVRILRVARFAARFPDFVVAPETMELMREMVRRGEVEHLVSERVWQEIERGLMARRPSRMFAVLRQCAATPWGANLEFGSGRMQALDLAADHALGLPLRFAVLCLQLGPSQLRALCERLRVPVQCRELAQMVRAEHAHLDASAALDPTGSVRLLQRCDAFRRPERFEDALRASACEPGAKAGAPGIPARFDHLRAALAAARAVDTGVVAERARAIGVGGPVVGEMVFQARVAAVAAL